MEIFKLFGSIMVNNDTANQAIDETDGKAKKTSKSFGEMLGSAVKVGAGIATAIGAAVVAVGGLAVSLTDDLQKSLNGVQSATGVADEAMVGMKDAMLDIYNNNFGESFEDIGLAMTTINQQTGLAGETLQKTTENALMLRDTFGMEVTESIRAVDMMMKKFGVTSEEAYNLIAQGAQSGLDKNENLLDSINEYSVHFEQLGFSAEEMFNAMANGAASGVFDIDKLGDAMKEFGIRSKDASDSSAAAFDTLGLDATKMTTAFNEGGESGRAAFDKVTQAIFAMDDKTAQAQVGVALFGTMWEDVGVAGMQALTNTQGEISNTVDALGKINEVKYNTFGEAMEGIKRNLQTGILIPLGQDIMPAMNGLASWVSTNMPTIQNEISFAMDIVSKIFDGIGGVIKTYIIPQFEAFGSLISKNMPQIQASIKAMYDYVKPSFDNLVNVIKTDFMPIIQGLWGLIEKAMPAIKVLFEVAMLAVGTALKIAMDVISEFIKAAKGIYDFIEPKIQLVIDLFNKVAGTIQWALDKLTFWNNTPAESKTFTMNYQTVTTATTMNARVGNNASGTDFWRGGPTWVNEQGGEIMNLPRGTQIIPHDVSMEMAKNVGGGGYGTANIYFELDGQTIVRAIGEPLKDFIVAKTGLSI